MDIVVGFDILVLTCVFFFILGMLTVLVYDYVKIKLTKSSANTKNKCDLGVIDFMKYLVAKLKSSRSSDK